MTTGPLSQCGTCQRLRSPFSPEATGQDGPWCEAFPIGIPAEVYDNTLDHRQPVDGDHGLQWLARPGATYPDMTIPGPSALVAHLPGKHDQRTHGHPREFTATDGPAFIRGHYGDWRSGLSTDETRALAMYQSPGFAQINGRRRGLSREQIAGSSQVPVTADSLRRADAAGATLQRTIDSAPPLTESIVAWRGFSADQFADLRAGATVRDKGFTSVAIYRDGVASVGGTGTSPAIAKITLPAGTRAAGGEYREMILQADSSFRVTSVRRSRGKTYVEMELVV